VRPGGVRVVTVGPRGFVERPVRPGYVSRTYVTGGRTQVRVYRSYTYRNVQYVTYVPSVYYQPAFYNWAYRRGTGRCLCWGWGSAPWYGYTVDISCPRRSIHRRSMADGLSAGSEPAGRLRLSDGAWRDISTEPVAQSSQGALSPEVKQMIADEVQQQLAAPTGRRGSTGPGRLSAYRRGRRAAGARSQLRIFVCPRLSP